MKYAEEVSVYRCVSETTRWTSSVLGILASVLKAGC
jgi:hypothetical protein